MIGRFVVVICWLLANTAYAEDAQWTLIDLGSREHVAYALRIGVMDLFQDEITIDERVLNLDTLESAYYKLLIPLNSCADGYFRVRVWDDEMGALPDVEGAPNDGQIMSEVVLRVCAAYHRNTNYPYMGY